MTFRKNGFYVLVLLIIISLGNGAYTDEWETVLDSDDHIQTPPAPAKPPIVKPLKKEERAPANDQPIGKSIVCIEKTPGNSMTGDLQRRPAFNEIWSWRDIRQQTRFVGHPIERLTVLNAWRNPNSDVAQNPDKPLAGEFADRRQRGFDLVVNGTFTRSRKFIPLGSVLCNGRFHEGETMTARRGGVAVLQDGTIVLARAQGNSRTAIESRFGTESNPVVQYMGGGALILEKGLPISSNTLKEIGMFDQGSGGLSSPQFEKGLHTIIAIRKGQGYVLANEEPFSGAELQVELGRHGFETAVMFDGDNMGYYNDGGLSGFTHEVGRSNPTGFGIAVPSCFVACYMAQMEIEKRSEGVAEADFYRGLTLEDLAFRTTTIPALLHVHEVSLGLGQAAFCTKGERIALPVKADGKVRDNSGEESLLSFDGALLFEIMAASRDRDTVLEAYPELKLQVSQKNYEQISPLLHFERADGTALARINKGAFKGEVTTGPIREGWPRDLKQKDLDFVKKDPELAKNCFLSTTVYGTQDNAQLRTFRGFRDQVLMASHGGRRIVETYYRTGPAVSAMLQGRKNVAGMLVPLFDKLAAFLSSQDWNDPTSRRLLEAAIWAVDRVILGDRDADDR